MIKRPYMPHRRRFLAIGAPTRPTPAAREIERLQRENAELRRDLWRVQSRLNTIAMHLRFNAGRTLNPQYDLLLDPVEIAGALERIAKGDES